MKHVNIRVSGRVQGVCFRDSTQIRARQLGLTGFVQNEPDGTVYLEAEGEEHSLDRLREWLRSGPTGASVKGLTEVEEDLVGFHLFEIRTGADRRVADGVFP